MKRHTGTPPLAALQRSTLKDARSAPSALAMKGKNALKGLPAFLIVDYSCHDYVPLSSATGSHHFTTTSSFEEKT